MSELDELINKLCPNGVEFQTLDILLDYEQPGPYIVASTNYEEEGTPVLTAGQSFILGYTNEERGIFRSSKEKPVIIFDDFTTSFHWVDFDFKVKSSAMKILNPKKGINFRYVYHAMKSIKYIPADHSRQWIAKYSQIKIPVPPMEVQCEIVRILDSFDELLTQLKDEFGKRNVEYKELANRMFDKISSAQRHTVKEVCSVIKGKSPIQKTEPGDYPMVVTTSERRSSKEYQFDCSAVCIPLISSRGHGVASLNHVYYQSGKFALGNILCAVIPNDPKEIDAKYLYYYFELTKDFTLVPLMKGGANVAMHVSDVENVKVPIPAIKEQEMIIDALTKYDNYLASLESEIESRQIQYEYYRNRLLTFREAE